MKTNRGFTLIELLVVMAIIAILIAILFPVFARARGKASQVKCLNNVRQIGMALGQYFHDYGAGPYCPAPGADDLEHWAITLQPYIHSEAIFRCLTAQTSYYTWEELPEPDFAVTYGINQYLVGEKSVGRKDMPNPSSLAMLADSASSWSGEGILEDNSYLWQASPQYAPTIHGQGAIFGFADSHAKWMPAQITSGDGQGYAGDYTGVYPGAVLKRETD